MQAREYCWLLPAASQVLLTAEHAADPASQGCALLIVTEQPFCTPPAYEPGTSGQRNRERARQKSL